MTEASNTGNFYGPYSAVNLPTTITAQIRARKILKEAEVLKAENAALFYEVVRQLSEKRDVSLGEPHHFGTNILATSF